MPNAQDQMDPRPLDIIEFTDPKAPFRFTWHDFEDRQECRYAINTNTGYRMENTWLFDTSNEKGLHPIRALVARTRFQSQFIVNRVNTGIRLANELLDSFLRSRSSCR